MPLEKSSAPISSWTLDKGACWAVWRILEPEDFFLAFTDEAGSIEISPKAPMRRMEWLASRYLAREMMVSLGQGYFGLTKSDEGKPRLIGSGLKISLSHSYPFVAVQIASDFEVGIDIEKPREQLYKVMPRVLQPEEYSDASASLKKLCLYWSAKEALFKIHGGGPFSFREHFKINPFKEETHGFISASVRGVEIKSNHLLEYVNTDEYVLITTGRPCAN
ncbi:MAG: 4'-phosphopantetheinyl transferase superfamily protein [Bacteroidetes bacterium]|nr:4'-phosphopantetheinyl transferase superfamily protein [Bacteroidota bacterium]